MSPLVFNNKLVFQLHLNFNPFGLLTSFKLNQNDVFMNLSGKKLNHFLILCGNNLKLPTALMSLVNIFISKCL